MREFVENDARWRSKHSRVRWGHRALPAAYDVAAEAGEREAAADRLTLEQATLLKVTRLLHRMEIRGGAGSGTTILALRQAKDLTRGQGDRKPQRVALVCYSLGLSSYFSRQLAGAPPVT